MRDAMIEAMAVAIVNGDWEDLPDLHKVLALAQARKALAALEAMGAVVGVWQDIASAPVNEVVWAYGTIGGDYGYTEDRQDMVKAIKDKAGTWYFAQPMGRHDRLTWRPTHWMPRPAAPMQEGEG